MMSEPESPEPEMLIYHRVIRLENDIEVMNTLVKTLYEQQVAQERAMQMLRKQLSDMKGKAWTRG